MGSLRDWSQGYSRGLLLLAAGLVLEALLVLSLKLPARVPAPAPSLAVASRPPVTAP